MKSVGTKITLCCVILVGASLLILGVFSSIMSYNASQSIAISAMEEIADTATDKITWELTSYSNIAQTMGSIQRLSNPDTSDEDKQALLDNFTLQFNLQRCNLIDASGRGLDGNTYNDREYFQAAMRGESWISEPLVSKITGELSTIVAAPVWKDGKVNSEAVGCVYVVPDAEFLNDIVRDINVSENGKAYMIDKNGNTIAAFDSDTVKNGENIEDLAKADSGYSGIAKIHELMRSGEEGFWAGNGFGASIFMAYDQVEGTNGWSVAVYCPSSDFMGEVYQAIVFTVIVLVVGIVVACFIAVILGKSIGRPISLCSDRIEKLADGDLTTPVPSIKRADEVGRLGLAMDTVVEKLNGMIGDIGRILEAMSNGNLAVDTEEGKEYYTGDFEKLRIYAQNIAEKLSGAMTEINVASDQVASGSEQVSGGAQALSQGTVEQSSSINELANSIHTISEQITLNSQNCTEARSMVNETAEFVDSANNDMTRFTEAMNDINNASAQISNIIKTIDDIAFQTNILSLNAAIEAARAGAAGKGFAVVADEVRNLAAKSSDAARETAALIQQSIEAVQKGTEIAAETAYTMKSVGERTATVEEIVNKIATASEQQAEMVVQINSGVEQISGVVQSNSATAEQSAASAEELSSQAETLKNLISTFKLRS